MTEFRVVMTHKITVTQEVRVRADNFGEAESKGAWLWKHYPHNKAEREQMCIGTSATAFKVTKLGGRQ